MATLLLSLLFAACLGDVTDTADTWLPGAIEALPGPCGRAPVTALVLQEHGRGWVGCGGAGGVYRTLDAGRRYEPMHPAARLEVNELLGEGRRGVLLCGREFVGEGEDPLLERWTPTGGWSTVQPGGPGAPAACGGMARDEDGGLALRGEAGWQLTLDTAGPDAWQPPAAWWGGPEDETPRLYDLAAGRRCWAAVGADLTGPPVFLRPASRRGCLPLEAVTVDPALRGELWALASPDGGQRWLAGGRELDEESRGRAVLYRSPDAGESWHALHLPGGLGWIRAVAFSASGSCGVAVGERADRAGGGFVLVSPDQGVSWFEQEADLPRLEVVAVQEEGFLVGGQEGFVGRGWCL